MAKQELQIFTGVKVPPMVRHGFGAREPKYPFGEMDVGDLLVIPETTSKAFGGTVRAGEKRTGFAFTLRTGPVADDEGNVVVPSGAVGVWRLAAKPPKKVLTAAEQAKRDANKAKKAAAKLAKAA